MRRYLEYLLKMHRFFVRESQHYVLGEWEEFFVLKGVKSNTDHPDSKKNQATYRYYNKNYWSSYFRFMWASHLDYNVWKETATKSLEDSFENPK